MTSNQPVGAMPATPREQLLGRLDRLAAVLKADPAALGLLALGSVGAETARLDAWSDLDFFVVVEPEAKSRYIADLAWLARAHPLAWSFRNTADGHKALMADGVLCEFAVFAPAELATVPYAPGRWIWRRDTLDAAAARPAVPLPAPRDTGWLVGEALSNLLVGLMRHARGERLAAMRMVQVCALDRVLELAGRPSDPSACAVAADPFNADRRIEARCPALAAQLPVWAGGYRGTVPAALALLDWLQSHHAVPDAVAGRIRELAAACGRQVVEP
jgi:hypothetical protein